MSIDRDCQAEPMELIFNTVVIRSLNTQSLFSMGRTQSTHPPQCLSSTSIFILAKSGYFILIGTDEANDTRGLA